MGTWVFIKKQSYPAYVLVNSWFIPKIIVKEAKETKIILYSLHCCFYSINQEISRRHYWWGSNVQYGTGPPPCTLMAVVTNHPKCSYPTAFCTYNWIEGTPKKKSYFVEGGSRRDPSYSMSKTLDSDRGTNSIMQFSSSPCSTWHINHIRHSPT